METPGRSCPLNRVFFFHGPKFKFKWALSQWIGLSIVIIAHWCFYPFFIQVINIESDTISVQTEVTPEQLPVIQPKAIPLWVYVVATMVGVFILSVIIIGLWKVCISPPLSILITSIVLGEGGLFWEKRWFLNYMHHLFWQS